MRCGGGSARPPAGAPGGGGGAPSRRAWGGDGCHGVGRQMHEDPQIPNYGTPGSGPILRPGMVIAIEPMVNIGDWRTRRDADNWTVRTIDGSLSAHFEHSLAITEGEPEGLP